MERILKNTLEEEREREGCLDWGEVVVEENSRNMSGEATGVSHMLSN